MSPRRRFPILVAIVSFWLPACTHDAHFDLLGYTVGSLHDTRYRTIYVPIFENQAFQAGPLRGWI